eukprot:Nitzschia sp. Nitz4//scaffold3_size479765//392720//393836//NITZ4_000169-RA/size479765-processed-gene-1.263-mRNA-1//1//CDS//3329550965//1369//frame0
MIWCFQPCFDDTSITMGQIVSMETTTPYIGHRPLVGTAGKVLMQGQKSPVSCSDPTRIQPGQTNSFDDEEEMDIIGVAVPPNIQGGQVIHVAHPDKSGRLIRVQVPLGLKPGDVFHVHAPSKAIGARHSFLSLATSNTSGDYDESEATTQQYSSTDYTDGSSTIEPVRPPRMRDGPPVANSIEDRSLTRKNGGPTDSRIFHSPALTRQKGIVKVNVPPGVSPGSTIHVQIPGSNRIVAATVPADCTEFHIEYEIFPSGTSKKTSDQDSRQPTVSREPSAVQTQTKLLLVHVPPGTPAGSVLHIQVPNEHGRLIQAVVPPNTRAFHVSYKPRFITNERDGAPIYSY